MTTNITFAVHEVALEFEDDQFAHFAAINSFGVIVAVAKAKPWGADTRPFISAVHVDPLFRRQGIARGLIRFIVDRARENGCDALAMYVHRDNTGAAALYRSEGFEAYYDEGEHIFLARKI